MNIKTCSKPKALIIALVFLFSIAIGNNCFAYSWNANANSTYYNYGSVLVGGSQNYNLHQAEFNVFSSSTWADINIIHAGAGAYNHSIDFWNWDTPGNSNPQIRLQTYDNAYSADFNILQKTQGTTAEPLNVRLHIDSTNGNISIGRGTTTPVYKLDVGGDINFTGNLYRNGIKVSTSTGGAISSYSTSTCPRFSGNWNIDQITTCTRNGDNITMTSYYVPFFDLVFILILIALAFVIIFNRKKNAD